MNLDDGMDTDAPGRREPRERRPRLWLLLAGTIAVTLLLFISCTGGNAETDPAPPPPTSAPPPSPAPEPAEHQHDHPEQVGATRAAWTAANTFLNGWTSTDPQARAKVFSQTTIDDLAEGLADTAEANIVTAPVTRVDVAAATPYSTEFVVHLDGRDPVWILLTSGHETSSSPYDWRVAELEERPA